MALSATCYVVPDITGGVCKSANRHQLYIDHPFEIIIIALILTSVGVTYYLECIMSGLDYLPLATNSPDSMTWPSMILFYWRVYGEDKSLTM